MAPIDSLSQDTQPYDPYTTTNLDAAQSAQAQQVQQQPSGPASNPDPVQAARNVLDVGVRSGRDDYDARMVALSDALKQGDPTYRSQLMGEILKQVYERQLDGEVQSLDDAMAEARRLIQAD